MSARCIRYSGVVACSLSILLAGLPRPAFARPASISGSVAGKIVDRASGSPVEGVQVRAQVITTNERLAEAVTDARGTFFISHAPAGVYGFTFVHEGREYPVLDRLDARAGMSFLLESCFQIDRAAGSASVVRGDCRSGLVPEARVVTLGAQRFLKPALGTILPADLQPETGPNIEHSGLECIPENVFAQISSTIAPGSLVENARVYFRSDKYPDFYYVDMQGTGDDFLAILPKPSPETEQVIYYIEALDQALISARTEDYDPDVAPEDACRRRDPAAAWFTGENPEIIIGATEAGMAAMPPGFQAAGIVGFVSASGVLSTVAAAAAGAGVGGGLTTSGLVLVITGVGAGTAVGVTVTEEREASDVRR